HSTLPSFPTRRSSDLEPQVLVMDEATSALDTATEAAVTDAIRSLRGSMTIVTVAHRLATVQASDEIFFMKDGLIAASGPFDDLVDRKSTRLNSSHVKI